MRVDWRLWGNLGGEVRGQGEAYSKRLLFRCDVMGILFTFFLPPLSFVLSYSRFHFSLSRELAVDHRDGFRWSWVVYIVYI